MDAPSKKTRTCLALILLTAAGVFLFAAPARALSIDSIAWSAVSYVVGSVSSLVLLLAGTLMSLVIKGLNFAINFHVSTDIPVVASTWEIVRNFTNMLFIIVMIAMAFSMIFKVSWLTDYAPGKIMVRFIIAALLINFSLVICGLIIDGTQSLNAIFITAIGDFSDRMGQYLNPSQWFATIPDKNLSNAPQAFFSSILLLVVDFSLIIALVFAFLRVPFIWLLVILSPLALLFGVLPITKKPYQEWWQQFIRWNFFLPIFLAVLYIGMLFLSQQSEVMKSIAGSAAASGSNWLIAGLDVSLQTLFFYTLVALVFIGGTNAAIKGSLVAGVGAVAGAKWAKDWTLRRTRIGAFGKAGKERFEEMKEKGYGIPGTQIKLFGGPAPGTEAAGRLFGVRGYEKQTLIANKVRDEKKKLEEEQRSVEELRGIMQKDRGYRGLAAGELILKEKKLLTGEVEDLRARYSGLKSPIAEKAFLERAQAQFDEMAEKNRFRKKSDFDEAYKLVLKDERSSFLDKAAKGNVNPVWIAEKRAEINVAKKEKAEKNPNTEENREILDDVKDGKLKLTKEEILEGILAKMTPKDILKLSPGTLEEALKDTAFKRILPRRLEPRDIAALWSNASSKHRDALGEVLRGVMVLEVKNEMKGVNKNISNIGAELGARQGEFENISRGIADVQDRIQREPNTVTTEQRNQLLMDQERARAVGDRLRGLRKGQEEGYKKLERLIARRERYVKGDLGKKPLEEEGTEEETAEGGGVTEEGEETT